MKKAQRGFAIEYKSSRRKRERNSDSIWGNLNLKSIAENMQEEPLPILREDLQDRILESEVCLSGEDQVRPLLTLSIGQTTIVQDLEESKMADEENSVVYTGTPAVVGTQALKKQRKPRVKKAAVETKFGDDATTAPAVGQRKRGRKPKSEGVNHARRAPVKRVSKVAQSGTASSISAIDEINELLQLEEENQKLRKMLAEKLRAENADLRKRLNLD